MITIVKIGGNVIDDADALRRFLADFARLEGPKVLVHGGGKLASRLSTRLGIETKMVEGRRVTDRETLEVVTMVYAGLTNKRIVAALSALGQTAVGLCGADGNAIRSIRRNPEPIDFGYVGDIATDGVNADFLLALTRQGIAPILCAITHDGHGQLLNTNADSVASAVAKTLAKFCPTKLVFCFEKRGVLRDVNDERSVIPTINHATFEQLKADGIVAAGMLPKITGALAAVDSGVQMVIIKHADDLLLPQSGTTITR